MTLIIFELLALIAPDPFGSRTRFPSVSVVLIVFPLISTLSTVSCVSPAIVVDVPPNEVLVEPIVIALNDNFAFAIDPASCAFETPNAFIVTSPPVTEKSLDENEAAPFAVVLASSIEIEIESPLTDVSIGSVPLKVSVSPVSKELVVPESAARLNEEVTVAHDITPEPLV